MRFSRRSCLRSRSAVAVLAGLFMAVTIGSVPGQAFAAPTPPPSAPTEGRTFETKETREIPLSEVQERHATARSAMAGYTECGEEDRVNSCRYYVIDVKQWTQRTPNSAPVLFGWWETEFSLNVRSDVRKIESTVYFRAQVRKVLPESIAGTMTIEIGVQEPNVGAGRFIRTESFAQGEGSLKSDQFAYYSPIKIENSANTATTFQYRWDSVTPVPDPSPPATEPVSQQVRCDKTVAVTTVAGCVNTAFDPTIYFPVSIYPYINPNIKNGQASGQPGGPGGTPLTRTDPANRGANQSAACSTSKLAALGAPPAPSGWSCDEYPFASSNEGGATATIAWVPSAENSLKQGTDIAAFYRDHRVMVGDPYYVWAP